jgi:hypothetical protein
LWGDTDSEGDEEFLERGLNWKAVTGHDEWLKKMKK